MARTLFEWIVWKLTSGKTPTVPDEYAGQPDYRTVGKTTRKYYNPLKLEKGDPVTLDAFGYRDLDFKVTDIREIKLQFAKSDAYPMVDYDLVARPLGGDPVKARLRLAPKEDADHAAGLTHDALLLKLDDEVGYDSGIENNILNDGTGKFSVDENDDGEDDTFFTRVHGVKDPYKARVAVLRDANRDGTVSDDEVRSLSITFWDYYRTAESLWVNKNGEVVEEQLPEPQTEFLIVEKDDNKSWYTIWRGSEFNTDRIKTLTV